MKGIEQGLKVNKTDLGRGFRYMEFDMHVFWFDTTLRDLAMEKAKKLIIDNAIIEYTTCPFTKVPPATMQEAADLTPV